MTEENKAYNNMKQAIEMSESHAEMALRLTTAAYMLATDKFQASLLMLARRVLASALCGETWQKTAGDLLSEMDEARAAMEQSDEAS